MITVKEIYVYGLGAYCWFGSLHWASHCAVSSNPMAFFAQLSLPQKLRFTRFASCGVSDVPTAAMGVNACMFLADKSKHGCLKASRPRAGAASLMSTQPRAPRDRLYYTLKAFAARRSIARGPQIHNFGAAVSYMKQKKVEHETFQ